MKTSLYSLFVATLALRSVLGAKPATTTKFHHHGRSAALSIRGGDVGPIKSKTLANTFSILASCDAVGGIFAPISSMKWCGVDVEKGSLSEHFVHGIGVSAATTALSSFLATNGKASLKQAIGYGLVLRLVSVTFMILTNKYSELGMNTNIFATLWVLLAGTTYALFADQGESLALAKALSLLLFLHGVFLYAKPGKFLSRASGIADKDAPLAQDLASLDGGYMMISGLVTGLLASGMDPAKVAGYAAISYMPVIVKLMDVVKVERFFYILDVEGVLIGIVALLAFICAGTVGGTAVE